MGKHKFAGYIAAFIATGLMGALGIFIRNISSSIFVITFSRLFFGFVFLTLFLMVQNQIKTLKSTPVSLPLLTTGVLMAGAILCYTNAIKSTSLANAVFLLYLGPLFAVGLASVFLKEKLSFMNAGILALAFLGFLFILDFKIAFNVEEYETYLWGLGSAVCYGLFIVGNRKISDEVPALIRAFYQLLFGSIAVIPFLDNAIFFISIKDIYWLVAIGLFQGFIAISLVTIAIKSLSAAEYGTISYTEPLVASLIGFFIYVEIVTISQFIGYILIFSSGIMKIALNTK